MKSIGTSKEALKYFSNREKYYKGLLTEIESIRNKTVEGGGKKAIDRQHSKGKLTARERVALLIDKDSEFFELNTFCAHEMYKEYGGAPSSGTIFGIGKLTVVTI